MNYYERHIGDYLKDAAHLSLLQHGVYARLMDVYYTREKPLPSDMHECCKLVICTSKPERDAVAYVLREFFELAEDGYHQKRCDEEIAAYLEAEPEREAKKENDKERQRRARERRKALFDALREHGIVPSWDTKTNDLDAILSRAVKGDDNKPVTDLSRVTVTQPVTPATCDERVTTRLPIPTPHSPLPTPHSPIEKQGEGERASALPTAAPSAPPPRLKSSKPKAKTRIPPDFDITEKVRDWAGEQGYRQIEKQFAAFVLKCKAKGYENDDWDAAFMVAIAEDWGHVRSASNGHGGAAEPQAEDPATIPGTRAYVNARALELGVDPCRADEQFAHFSARVQRAATQHEKTRHHH